MSELTNQLILDLQERMDQRFDRVDKKFDAFDERLRFVENKMTIYKTIMMVVGGFASFLGWDHLKPWLTSLIRS